LGFVAKAKAPAILIEVCFVDDKDDADLYTKTGYQAISKAIVEAVLDREIITEKKPVKTVNSVSKPTLYKVQVGAFGVKENAEKLTDELRAKGYTCTIAKA
jgi:N-acetylmuramoyl-L-alanine amidase